MRKQLARYGLVLALLVAVGVPLVGQAIKDGPAGKPATEPAKVDPDKVVMTVGDQKTTAGEFEAFVNDLPPDFRNMVRQPGGTRMLADDMVKYKLLAAEAQKRGLADTPAVKRKMATAREQVLAQTLRNEVLDKIDEADVRKWYEEHKSEHEKVQARHILVRMAGSQVPVRPGTKDLTDEQAKAKADDLRKRLVKGEDFAAMAKAESDDVGSGEAGGDLPLFGRGQMVKAFDDSAFALKEKEISEPVKTQFGYHIIQVQKHRSASLDDLKDMAKEQLGESKFEALIGELKKTNKTELDETFFGPVMPHGMGPHEVGPPE